MQQNQQGRLFTEMPQEQPVYRFPQNQSAAGWQAQQGFQQQPVPHDEHESIALTPKERRKANRVHKHKRRRIFTLWNLFAVIGIITVIIQAARYIVIPALVYLNILSGGVL